MTKKKTLGAALACCLMLTAGLVCVPASAVEKDTQKQTATDTGTDIAKTPPMGWNSWNAYGCNVSEDKITDAIGGLGGKGLDKAGYDYVVIDDCWQGARDSAGRQASNPSRFPHGVKYLADKAHADGLKLGIYGTPGTKTCANQYNGYKPGNAGSQGHERQDADTWASQGIDYLKYDWCAASGTPSVRYDTMRDALTATGRPIVYSINADNQTGVETEKLGDANMWRDTKDLKPIWDGTKDPWFVGVIDSLNKQPQFISRTGPGSWADADMLQVGNMKSQQEERTHFAMWSMLPSPLMLGTNLSNLTQEDIKLVTNPRLVAVNQDTLGKGATQASKADDMQVWTRPMANGDTVVAVINTSAKSMDVAVDLTKLGLKGSYTATNLWAGGTTQTSGTITAKALASHDTAIWRLSAATGGVQASKATLRNYYANDMVFQHDKSFAVMGTTNPNASITVTVGSQSATTTARSDGSFRALVPSSPARLEPYKLTVSSKGRTLKTIDRVYSGNLIMDDGQSNMKHEWAEYYRDLIKKGKTSDGNLTWDMLPKLVKDSNVHLLKTQDDPWDRIGSSTPRADVVWDDGWNGSNGWYALDGEENGRSGDFSYLAQYAASQMRSRHPDIPVGIVQTCVKGSKITRHLPGNRSDNLYNQQIAPFKGFHFGAVIWLQGEGEYSGQSDPAAYYNRQLSKLIDIYRDTFDDPDMPFVWATINRDGSQQKGGMPYLETIRGQMRTAVSGPKNTHNLAVSVTMDTDRGTNDRVHCGGKEIIGARVGRQVQDLLDGKGDDAESGPVASKAVKDGSDIIVSFKAQTGQGLKTMKPNHAKTDSDGHTATATSDPLDSEFQVSDDGSKWMTVPASIDGATVVVHGTGKYVRYMTKSDGTDPVWVYNARNLPAGPFALEVAASAAD